jgi:hypothetical protein
MARRRPSLLIRQAGTKKRVGTESDVGRQANQYLRLRKAKRNGNANNGVKLT